MTMSTSSKEKHPLHNAVVTLLKKIIENNQGAEARLLHDPATKGKQNIPLFAGEVKSNRAKLCCVDALVIVRGKVRLIVEVDESNIIPTQVVGKFFTSALANFYEHRNEVTRIRFASKTHFLQVISSKKLGAKSQKPGQLRLIEELINDRLADTDQITKYKLFVGRCNDFRGTGQHVGTLKDFVRNAIGNSIR